MPTEEERVRRMIEMFKPKLAMAIDSGNQPPVTVADCLERAVRAEYRLTQVKEERAQFFKARKEERTKDKQSGENKKPQGGGMRNHSNSKSWNNNQSHHNNPNNKKRGKPCGNHYSENRNVQQKSNYYNSHPLCKTCGKNHPGECRKGTMSCFACGQSGHFVKDCPKQNQPQGNQFQSRNNIPRLNAMQPALEGPAISQGRLEAPVPQARLYAYTNADAVASTSNVVAGQTSLASYDVYTLFDTGVSHSFISTKLALSISNSYDRTPRLLRTALPSGEILISEFFLRKIPIIINGVMLRADLIAIEMKDFDVILGMDFLGEHNAVIDCYHRKVTFRPNGGEKFAFKGRSLLNHKMIISSMRAQKMLSNGCVGFLASIVDMSKE